MDMPANAKMQTISGKKYVFIDTPYQNAEKHVCKYPIKKDKQAGNITSNMSEEHEDDSKNYAS